MRFLGNKDSLTDDILQLMTEKGVLDKDAVFFDAFCGMGSVCDSVKQTFPHLIINDILHCCTTFTEGRLYANGCKFETLGFSPFDFFANNPVVRKGFIYSTYAPKMSGRMYFTDENASRIDYFRYQIEEWYQEYRINDPRYASRVKYYWMTVNDNSHVKLYQQMRPVTYADYRANRWYISPFEVQTKEN